MPNWKIHLEVAKRIGKKINYNKEEMQLFLLGNILPDINNGYIVTDISTRLQHDFTHYRAEKSSTYMYFYNLHKKDIKNPVLCGYLVHLFTDYFFNKDFYLRSRETELKDLTHDELRIIKQSDFQSYNDKFLTNKLEIDDIKKAESATKIIENISVNSSDIKKVIEFLSKQETSNIQLKFYKIEELDALMERTLKKLQWLLSTLWIIRK